MNFGKKAQHFIKLPTKVSILAKEITSRSITPKRGRI
jgi:hypothetical protein